MVIVLGSGGHTAEMMSLIREFDPRRYLHRTYITSSGDEFSSGKAKDIEARIQRNYTHGAGPSAARTLNPVTGIWELAVVPRARKIHQPLYTTPMSSLWCLLGCLRALQAAATTSIIAPFEYPDLIVTNGPATAVMVILASSILKFFGVAPVWKMKVIYVESWARVKTLSLSGRVLLHMGVCDRFLVQWEALANKINGNGSRNKVEWYGFLVEI